MYHGSGGGGDGGSGGSSSSSSSGDGGGVEIIFSQRKQTRPKKERFHGVATVAVYESCRYEAAHAAGCFDKQGSSPVNARTLGKPITSRSVCFPFAERAIEACFSPGQQLRSL